MKEFLAIRLAITDDGCFRTLDAILTFFAQGRVLLGLSRNLPFLSRVPKTLGQTNQAF